MILSGWRLAACEYAMSSEQMLSGEGAFLYGGRWNNKGQRVVYLGSSLAMAALELLVHMPNANDVLKSRYRCLQVRFDSSLLAYVHPEDLPANWAQPSMASPVRHIGDQWLENQASMVLQVPSAVIPLESNYLLNPNHPDAGQLSLGELLPFHYDSRLANEH